MTLRVLRTALPAMVIAALSLTLLVRERRAALRMATLTDRLAESWPLYLEDQLTHGEIDRLEAEIVQLDADLPGQRARCDMAWDDFSELLRLEDTRLLGMNQYPSVTVAKQLPEQHRDHGPVIAEELALGTILLHRVVVAYYCSDFTDAARGAWRGFVRPCDDAASAAPC